MESNPRQWAKKLRAWVEGESLPMDERVIAEDPERIPGEPAVPASHPRPDPRQLAKKRGVRVYSKLYPVCAVAFGMALIFLLLVTISWLPRLGSAEAPGANEVTRRYIEDGLEETGAVNIVSGIILDYRAFDTFGESCVLFTAVIAVFILLKQPKNEQEPYDRLFEPKNDVILQTVARMVIPFGLILGIYILLNGHLGPGGGFSGGAILGAVLILYTVAFGFQRASKLFNEKVFRWVTTAALSFYCLAKGYSFFTGANHLESGIPLGTPGAILSSGLILPLNVCVGLVVACTMYGFYSVFRRNDI